MKDDNTTLILLEEAYLRLCRVEEYMMDINVIGKNIDRKKIAEFFVRAKKFAKDVSNYLTELENAQEDYEEGCPCLREGCKALCDKGCARHHEEYD